MTPRGAGRRALRALPAGCLALAAAAFAPGALAQTVSFSAATHEVTEGGVAGVEVRLSTFRGQPTTVTLTAAATSTATAGKDDFGRGVWTVTLPAGANRATARLSTRHDNVPETHGEHIALTISKGCPGVAIATPTTARIDIAHDERTFRFSMPTDAGHARSPQARRPPAGGQRDRRHRHRRGPSARRRVGGSDRDEHRDPCGRPSGGSGPRPGGARRDRGGACERHGTPCAPPDGAGDGARGLGQRRRHARHGTEHRRQAGDARVHHGTLERPQGVTVTAGAGADTTGAAATLAHSALGAGEGSVGGTVRGTVVDGGDPVAHRTTPGRTHDLPEGAKRAHGRAPGVTCRTLVIESTRSNPK